MKRYIMHVPPYSNSARPYEDPKGKWVEYKDVKKGIELLKTTVNTLNEIEDLRGITLYELITKYLKEIGEDK